MPLLPARLLRAGTLLGVIVGACPALARGGAGTAIGAGRGTHGPAARAGAVNAPAHSSSGTLAGQGRHHHPCPPWFGVPGGFTGGPLWYRSAFYDPFYAPAFMDRPEDSREKRHSRDNVVVRVQPESASVYVNGILYSSRGHAPFSLPSGLWNVELRAPGYLPQVVELRVEQGVTYTVERRLQKDPADPH